MTGAAQHRDAQRGPVTSGVRGGSRPSGGAKCRPSRGAKGVRRDLPGELTTAATSHFPARPKPWREVGVRGAWARKPPRHFALPRLLQLRPLVLVRSPLTRLMGGPPPRPPGSLPSSGGPWASARELGATCVPISPLASQPLPPPCTILTRLRTSPCPMGSDRPSFKPPARCSPEAHAQGPSLFCDADGTLLSAQCPWKSCLLNRPPARWWREPGPLAEAAQLCRSLAPLRAPREALGTCDHSPRR